eukprot:GEMP01008643.1.p1 GENE.GEMP01008643.1~~GEMP01008643.1.p1  ORF type:complete len:630 (+),score=112.76 GEMP01008643.1:27-1892(+)
MDVAPGVLHENKNSNNADSNHDEPLSDAETVVDPTSKRRKIANPATTPPITTTTTTPTIQAGSAPATVRAVAETTTTTPTIHAGSAPATVRAVAETAGTSASRPADCRTDTVTSNQDSATIPIIIVPPTKANLATHRHEFTITFPQLEYPPTGSKMSGASISNSDMTSSGSLFQEKPTKTETRLDTPSTASGGLLCTPPTSPNATNRSASQTPSPQPTDAKVNLAMKRRRQTKNSNLTLPATTAAGEKKTRQRRQKVLLHGATATNAVTQSTTTSSTNQDAAAPNALQGANAATGTATQTPLPRPRKERVARRERVKKENENPDNNNCDVAGCRNVAEKMIDATDVVGPPGWRCVSHIPGAACSSEGCNLYGRMRKRDGAVYCRTHIQQCVVAKCVRTGRLRCSADLYGDAGWRCKHHGGGHKCNVQGCLDSGQVKAVADRLGPAGYRCDVHGRICLVPGCKSMGLSKRPADGLGPEGRRCTSHGGARKCNVLDCLSNAKLNIKVADSHGAAGPRCDRHSRICTADGCYKVGQRRCNEDFRGPAGYRCLRHGGGHECNVDNCNCIGQVRKKEADQFGPSGYRCNQHGQFCVISNCGRGGRCKRPADALGPAGYRCRAHVCP